MEIIRADAAYAKTMDEKVVPYLAERCREGWSRTHKGDGQLYYRQYISDEGRGTIVLLHGLTEGIDKFRETVYYFLTGGYHVWLLQQREHGRSVRSTEDISVVNITDFREMVRDVRVFVREIVKKSPLTDPEKLYLFGHSMGGGVSACYLEAYPEDFKKAVLSSPMLEITSAPIPLPAAKAFANLMIAVGKGASRMPGANPFSDVPDFENSCGNSPERYAYWFDQMKAEPAYQMCIPSVATTLQLFRLTQFARQKEMCKKVRAQVLLMQAGKDTMVLPGGQETFIAQIGEHGRIARFPEAKHEIYLCTDEILEEYWKEILAFL